jgi:hypothetical protein
MMRRLWRRLAAVLWAGPPPGEAYAEQTARQVNGPRTYY